MLAARSRPARARWTSSARCSGHGQTLTPQGRCRRARGPMQIAHGGVPHPLAVERLRAMGPSWPGRPSPRAAGW